MLSPSGMLDCRNDLHARLSTSEAFRLITSQQFYADWQSDWVKGQPKDDEGQRLVNNADYLTDRIAKAVPVASLYRVTEPMVDLLMHAAAQLDADDTFDPDLAPAPHGLVYFAKPVPVYDLRKTVMLGHWLLWCPVSVSTIVGDDLVSEPATLMVWWNDNVIEPDMVQERMLTQFAEETHGTIDEVRSKVNRITGRWSSIGSQYLAQGAPIGELMAPVAEEMIAAELAKLADAPLGEAATEADVLASHTTNLARVAHALWLMMGQTVALTHEERVERHAVKRATRAKLPAKVTVVKLRREREQTVGGHETREYDHHWIVNGHWRWQPFGPGRTQRRRIWIAPFMKGDLSKPLLTTEKIYSLDR